ncbi:sigma-54 dependent transcriptional regulator [Idiomarina sp.]|uniref:sigma-54-dependent transcriptional regulator n=1 Tax=Idiomarina sp. TaxID=1874361 RepID=UPI001E03DB34|nr:sigma-54 dependent transcriptional regulator [Idiomarina sp.]MCJ8317817.1 sigma-54 dependent transcriptional regulator [Idiomarina sp.]NQZ17490.1 sigma-54-dependent Fis family transcriptional regulator [Idiomarina sp.]
MAVLKAVIGVVEDDPALQELLVEELEAEGYQVDAWGSLEDFKSSNVSPDLIVSDIRLPGESGLTLLEDLKRHDNPPALLLITAFGTVDQAVDALKKGADDFLTKPLDIEHLLLSVDRILEHRSLQRELKRYKQQQKGPGGLVGQSPAMRKLYDQIEHIAPTGGSVLITGESGTGKELVAKALHELSDRSDKPFQAVNCAGIPADLMESEFFGHAAGAFTGAQNKRQGLLKQADGGTLLLDEIGEMPMALQAKLLRVLQEGTIRAVGSDKEEQVDVRILAATHQDLERLVEEGKFRQDLFYRLETFSLRVPPLRERGEDIERLANFFLQQQQKSSDKTVRGISAEALDLLYRYPFPGNVRELQNAIERAFAFSSDETLSVDDFPQRIVEKSDTSQPAATSAWPTLDEHQSQYIRKVLEHTDGNKSQAAQILGVTRRTLYRWLDNAAE